MSMVVNDTTTKVPVGAATMPPGSRNVEATDSNEQRLRKIIPADVVAAYLGVRSVIDPGVGTNGRFVLVFGILIFLLIWPYFRYALKVDDKVQIIFAMFTYVVWAANIDIQWIMKSSDQLAQITDPTLRSILQFVTDRTFISGLLALWALILIPMITLIHRDPTVAPPSPDTPKASK